MRNPRVQHSRLRFPLDDLLGSPAHVRLIRTLVHEAAGSVSVMDAARMAGLSAAGARKALETLEKLGIAARIGTGRAQKYGLKEGNPYSSLLRLLFEQEQQRYEDLVRMLQHALSLPEVRDAWIRVLPVEPGESLQLDVVAGTKATSWISPELRTRLIGIEKQYDMIIELAIHTRADRPVIPGGAIVLWGMGNVQSNSTSMNAPASGESAERSLRMAYAIASLIKIDPSLIRRALLYTNRLLHEGQGIADSDIGEWRQILETYSPERIRDFIVSTSSRADRLRRSLPFLAVLTPDERDRVFGEAERSRR